MRRARRLVPVVLLLSTALGSLPVAPASAAATATPTWPTAETTGVPVGTALRASPSIVASTPGTIIEGRDVNGCVTVKASDVVIRRSRIRCDGRYPIRIMSGAVRLVVEDTDIIGTGLSSVAVCCSHYTLRRVDISGSIDGPRLGPDTVVEDSWIHHLTRVPDSHNDTLQITGGYNVIVRRNRLEPFNPVTRDPMNAALMIGSTTAKVGNMLIENNLMNGGGYAVNTRADAELQNVLIRNNTIGLDCRYGAFSRTRPGMTITGNAWVTGAAATTGAGPCRY